MAKDKIAYVCSNCGQESAKWIGKCPACGQWNTFKEIKVGLTTTSALAGKGSGGNGISAKSRDAGKVLRLRDISSKDDPRIDMRDQELNRVLGGGLVPGSIVLLGGEPGIGKSTLSLQTMLGLSDMRILYVSGEESAHQLKMRAERLLSSSTCQLVNSSTRPHRQLPHSLRKLLGDHLRTHQGGAATVGGHRLHPDHRYRGCRVQRRLHRPGT